MAEGANRGGNSGLAFIVGALVVVAIVVLAIAWQTAP